MDTPTRSTHLRRTPARRALEVALATALAGILFTINGVTPASAQGPFSMAWIFDGPGCRQGPGAAPRGACADEALVTEMIRWAGRHLGLEPPPAAPRVQIVSQAEMASHLCATAASDCQGIMAAYDAASRTIFLRDFLDMRRAPDRSFLVHELAHVLQHQRQGDRFQALCSEVVRTEREAYQLQNRYLADMGQLQRVGQMMAMMDCPREDGDPVLRGAAARAAH